MIVFAASIPSDYRAVLFPWSENVSTPKTPFFKLTVYMRTLAEFNPFVFGSCFIFICRECMYDISIKLQGHELFRGDAIKKPKLHHLQKLLIEMWRRGFR